MRRTARVNPYYCYGIDADFGPFWLPFGSSFADQAKLCRNGPEYVQRPLAQEGIACPALDNGVVTGANPERRPHLGDEPSATTIDVLLGKWLACLPFSCFGPLCPC